MSQYSTVYWKVGKKTGGVENKQFLVKVKHGDCVSLRYENGPRLVKYDSCIKTWYFMALSHNRQEHKDSRTRRYFTSYTFTRRPYSPFKSHGAYICNRHIRLITIRLCTLSHIHIGYNSFRNRDFKIRKKTITIKMIVFVELC